MKRITIMLIVLLLAVFPVTASATTPESVCFEIVAGLGGTPGTWSSSGLVTSSGTAIFNPFAAGWDAKLDIPASVHDSFVATDEYGSISFKAQGHSALVVNAYGDTVPGWLVHWVILSGTGAYATLHGQGDGYAWIDWANEQFLAFQCGQAHFDP